MVSDGEVRRGHAGLAGEIAHVVTAGPAGVAMRLIEVFAALGLRRPGSTAIDVPALLRRDRRARGDLARAVGGVLSAAVALADPAVVLLGGPWGRDRVLAAVAREFAQRAAPRAGRRPPRSTTSRRSPARATAALEQLRDAVVAARQGRAKLIPRSR